jgi:hypothetical protein
MNRFSLIEKLGLLISGVLLVALAASFARGATTPNSIITTQSVSTYASVVLTGDKTTAAPLCAAGVNGTRITKILVYPDTDGTSGDRKITIYVYSGTTAYQLCLTTIPGNSTAPVIPVDVLANVPLPLDSNGNKYLEIPSGYSIYISGENVTANNPVIVLKQDY